MAVDENDTKTSSQEVDVLYRRTLPVMEPTATPRWLTVVQRWPTRAHCVVAGILIASVAVLDVNRPSLSIFYLLPSLYVAWTMRGRGEWAFYGILAVTVFLAPFLSVPSRANARGFLNRAFGASMGLVMVFLIRERRRFADRLQLANEQLEAQVVTRSGELEATIGQLWQSEQRLRQHLTELTVLNHIGVICSESRSEDEVLHRTTSVIAETLFPDNCGFLLLDAERQVLVTHPSFVLSDPSVSRADKPLGTGITGQVALTGQARCVGDVSLESDYLAADSRTRSEMCIPMQIASKVVGVLNIESRKPNAFSSIDEQLANTVVDLVGNSLERLRAAQALRWNEERLQQLFDNSPDAVFVEDLNGQVLDVNPAACRLHEMDRAELIGKNMLELVPPAERAAAAAAFQRTVSGEITELEGFSWAKSQTAIPVELRVNRIDYFGQPALLLHVRDITARKRVELALRHSEQQFTFFMQHLPGLAWIKDDEGRYVFANAAAEKAFGVPLSMLIGKTDRDLFPPETAAQIQAADRKALSSGTEVRTIESLKHRDGVLHHSIVSKFLLPSAGAPRKLVGGMAIDITEQRQAEEALQMMRFSVDHAGDSVFWVNRAGRILYANDAACSSRGYSSEELLGMTIFDLDPDFQPAVWNPHFEDLKKHGTLTFETRHRTKDGRIFPIEVNANYVHIGEQEFNFAFVRDISERKRNEALLRGQNHVLEMIAASSPLTDTLTDLLLHIEALSSEMCCSILLLDADGQHLRHGAAPSLPADYTKAIDGVAIGPNVGSCGTAAFRGETVIVEDIETDPLWANFREVALPHRLRACWSAPILDSQNRVLGTFAIYYRQPCRPTDQHRQLIDIATRSAAIAIGQHREQNALRESEERFQAFMNQSPVVAWAKDEEFRYRYVNAAFEKLFNKPASQILGQMDRDLYPEEFAQATRAHDRKVRSSGEILESIEHVPGFDGKVRSWLVQKFPLHRSDQQTWVGATAVDISSRLEAEKALRENEARFRLLFEGANDAIFWADAETGLLTHCNPAAERLLGQERAEIIGQHQSFLHPPEELDRYREIFRTHATAQSKTPIEVEVLRKDGHRVPVSISPSVTDIAGHKVLQGIFRDITERKQMEKELSLRQSELLHASRLSAIGQMVAGLSHEVAQPLNAISNFAVASTQLLNSDTAGPFDKLKEYVQTISDQSRRCAAILQRLRDFSRRAPTLKVRCDLNPLLRESVELIASETRRREARIQWKLAGELPQIAADRVQIQQVVFNLLNNALDAVRDQNLERRWMTVRSYAETNFVVLEVEDHGPGIAKEIAHQLFEPFITTKQDGMGIGLSISKTIVNDHGGTIEASSNEFGGATFRVRLPCPRDVS